MKIKFLSFVFALVMAVMLSACSTEAPKPTGDVEKDTKAFTEYIQKVDLKDAAAVKEADKVIDEFKKYYTEGEGKDKAEEFEKGAKEATEKFINDAEKALISTASPSEESKSE